MIPGWLISIVTFPGVIVHEIAHQFFCRLFRVAVFEVCYFRIGNPAGYVVHEAPRKGYQNIMISVGPFLFNSIVGAVIAAPGAIPVLQFEAGSPLDYALVWLGISIAMHSFPSTGDAKSMWQGLWSGGSSVFAKLLGGPLVVIIYAGAIGSIFWLDLVYGIGVALLLPKLLIWAIAWVRTAASHYRARTLEICEEGGVQHEGAVCSSCGGCGRSRACRAVLCRWGSLTAACGAVVRGTAGLQQMGEAVLGGRRGVHRLGSARVGGS